MCNQQQQMLNLKKYLHIHCFNHLLLEKMCTQFYAILICNKYLMLIITVVGFSSILEYNHYVPAKYNIYSVNMRRHTAQKYHKLLVYILQI